MRAKPDPMRVFEKFFGTANPFTALLDCAPTFQNEGHGPKSEVGQALGYTVELTLEEVFTGVRKTVQHRKRIHRPNGQKETLDVPLAVEVPAGVLDGEHFVFDKEGKESWGPVVVTARVLPHNLYTRVGNTCDICHTARLPLVSALCGSVLSLKALDGRIITVSVPEVTTGDSLKTVEGMGLPRGDGTFGQLVIRFVIVFPKSLTDTQKTLLRAAFFLPETRTAEQAGAVKAFSRAFEDAKSGWSHGYPRH